MRFLFFDAIVPISELSINVLPTKKPSSINALLKGVDFE